jgi:hypothetical protein
MFLGVSVNLCQFVFRHGDIDPNGLRRLVRQKPYAFVRIDETGEGFSDVILRLAEAEEG